eukprot:gnl/MRDRNA2_/MRDRNA2_140166_c0_seq1.p1 gnl/MRDRNA2_/MRDRNA2_140166_c0~~gnl/MRDRNA2_/MRDRNA2_140166_c0_seq1.p1  ORF type:complete len:210 (-),score=32.47 gnl/MRDRNA2_/MRDRNA2_140166_c0_seq1:370-999(-)
MNIMSSFAKVSKDCQVDGHIWAVIASEAERRIGGFTAANIAETCWSFALATQSDSQLFTSAVRATEPIIGDFKEAELASMARSYACVGQADKQLFTLLARMAVWRMSNFHGNHVAIIMKSVGWAFVTVGMSHTEEPLFKELGKVAGQRLVALTAEAEGDESYLNMQTLATTAWAFAKAVQCDTQLFTFLGAAAARSMGTFTVIDLTKTT